MTSPRVEYSEVMNEDVKSRNAKGIRGEGGGGSTSLPYTSAQNQSTKLVGQQSHSHKPYRPLGDMRSVLSLKVAVLKEDHLTGEIKSLEHNRLKLSTSHMGTIYIEWDKIARVQTNQYLLLERSDGVRYYG